MDRLITAIILSLAFVIASACSHSPAKTIYQASATSVLQLKKETNYGTGFVLEYNNQKYILTNKHICQDGEEIVFSENLGQMFFWVVPHYREEMDLYWNQEKVGTEKVLKISEEEDLCLLNYSGSKTPFKLSDSKLEVMDPVMVLGYPKFMKCGEPLVMEFGHYQGDFRQGDEVIHMSSARVLPGNSGSPLLNESGEVVGIVFAYFATNQFSSFIPLDKIREFLKQ